MNAGRGDNALGRKSASYKSREARLQGTFKALISSNSATHILTLCNPVRRHAKVVAWKTLPTIVRRIRVSPTMVHLKDIHALDLSQIGPAQIAQISGRSEGWARCMPIQWGSSHRAV